MPRGFALVSVLMMMALVGLLALGMLSLSKVTMRSGGQHGALEKARSNARIALMVAIGELQKEMGPDMRVSAKAALFDQNPGSEAIDGVGQPNWLASYESWGSWLNAPYKNPATGETLDIADTYTPKREKMFRRWLLSMPDGMSEDINAPMSPSGLDDDNSVVLVGEGSLGALAASSPEQVTRAYLKSIGENGRNAWWISPENQKARIDMAKRTRNLTADNWESSSGDTAEVGVGSLPGLDVIDSDGTLSAKLISRQSLRPAGADADVVQKHYFDLTASSRGVLTSVRTGQLKKDLSLLFEKPKADLPSPYRFESGDIREPSIRPMSPELAAKKPKLPERHFASWTRMRHFYRMYHQDADALAPDFGHAGLDGSPGLQWAGNKPWTDINAPWYHQKTANNSLWMGEDTYHRYPILTHISYILSVRARPTSSNKAQDAGKYDLNYIFSPVCVYWNPYNVELRLGDEQMMVQTTLQTVRNLGIYLYENGIPTRKECRFHFDNSKIKSDDGNDIVFSPGEFRIFSADDGVLQEVSDGNVKELMMFPGFDPDSVGGSLKTIDRVQPNTATYECEILFSHLADGNFTRNFLYGNTPASFLFLQHMAPNGESSGHRTMNFQYNVDWFETYRSTEPITNKLGEQKSAFLYDGEILPIGYIQLALKGLHDYDYPTIDWEQDWRCRNWLQAPPFYLGTGMYMSDDETTGHTQRIDCPYELRFGSLLLGSGKDVDDIIEHVGSSAILGKSEKVTAAPMLELPTAPIGSLAGFGTMRINPGWVYARTLNDDWTTGWDGFLVGTDTTGLSYRRGEAKAMSYQSGVTGPGIGNSFVHPMIPRTEVYQFFNNSISMEMKDWTDTGPNPDFSETDTKAYCDYWDHVLLLNDALWDDYFVSSLADQTRPGASASKSLSENLQKLVDGELLANSRYIPYLTGRSSDEVKADLDATEGYLKSAAHLMVDGMFNVNSTSVSAWYALFAGIRERKVVYRDQSGTLKPVAIPSDKRIAISRFSVATTDQEGNDPEFGVTREDGMQAWSGVRFLDDSQLRKLAEESVKQVKLRGPFLNFSEFINRRLSDDDLGTMGALQSAIDYDDASPESGSINYPFKSNSDYMLKDSDLGTHAFETPEAAVGSRFAGIPGYVIQSDLLKPIANTLSVRDDTFRIRAYGDTLDEEGNILARAWCEAVVQRVPEYSDDVNDSDVPAREMKVGADGKFTGEFSDIEDSDLTLSNLLFGRKFRIESFRWLSASEI